MTISKHVFELELYVDDDLLKAHNGNEVPPPNDVDDWDPSDIFEAARLGIIEPRDGAILSHREVTEE